MMLLKAGTFLLVCLATVSAKDKNDGESSSISTTKGLVDNEAEPSTNIESKVNSKPLAKASKVSEFYIGDLLRTHEKDQLDTASTIHSPISSTPEYSPRVISPEDAGKLLANFEGHRGQVFSEDAILVPLTQRDGFQSPVLKAGDSPLNKYEQFSVPQAGNLGRNAMSGFPVTRRYEHPRAYHPKGPDCKDHVHSSSASHEDAYSSHERSPYVEGRASYGPSEYDRQGSYRQEDSYEDSPGYSESYPTSSKSYTSNHDSDTRSKSKSGETHTTSKSTSSSKTVNPSTKRGKVHVFDVRKPNQPSYSRDQDERPRNKNKARPHHSTTSYSDERPTRYGPTGDQPPTQYNQGYSSEAPNSYTQTGHSNTNSPSVQKQPYSDQPAPSHYDRGNYRDSREPHGTRYYKDGHSQPEVVQRERPHTSSPQHYSSEDSVEQPSSPYKTRNHEESYGSVEKPVPHRGGNRYHKDVSYNSPGSPKEPQQYQQEHHSVQTRPRKRRPQSSNHGYSHTDAPTRSGSPYDRSTHYSRPSEPKREEYAAHQAAPYTNGESDKNYQRTRRPPGRATRSSAEYLQPAHSKARSPSPEARSEHKPHVLISKESIPQVSRSVSYSESSYNLGEDLSPTPNPTPQHTKVQSRMYEQPQKMINPLLSGKGGYEAREPGYQAPYKPSYPGRYMNDQYQVDSHEVGPYNDGPHSGERGPPQPYEEPHGDHRGHEDGYIQDDHQQPKGEIIGYQDNYDSDMPLELDDEFFQKYGISKKAKIIVATAMNPNLLVADGSQLPEGGSSGDGLHEERRPEPSSEDEEHSFQSRPREFEAHQDSPQFRPQGFEVDQEAPQFRARGLEALKEAPQSFTELVHSDPKFLRNVGSSRRGERPEIGEFGEYDPSLDELVFRSGVGDPKAFVRSQGSREIVQQHGNGVSRIIFNQATRKQAASENKEDYKPRDEIQDDESIEAEKSEKVEKVVKPAKGKD